MPNLSDYGIDLTMVQDDPIKAIGEVLSQYESAAKNYRDAGEKSTTGVKAVMAQIKSEDPATVNLTDDLMVTLRKEIYHVLTSDPAVSVLLFEALQELKEGIASFRTEAMRNLDLPTEESEGEPIDLSAQYEEVEFLHKALANFVNFAQMNGLAIRDLPSEIRAVNKKSNKSEVKLPRKPNGPETKESDSPVKGKHASHYQMRYTLNGNDVPTGISVNRLALFYCSTDEEWINGSELMAHVDKITDGQFAKGDWEVQVPAGTLKATKSK